MATTPAIAKMICQGTVPWPLSTVGTAMHPPTGDDARASAYAVTVVKRPGDQLLGSREVCLATGYFSLICQIVMECARSVLKPRGMCRAGAPRARPALQMNTAAGLVPWQTLAARGSQAGAGASSAGAPRSRPGQGACPALAAHDHLHTRMRGWWSGR